MKRVSILLILVLALVPVVSVPSLANESDPIDAWSNYNRTDAFSSIDGIRSDFDWEYNLSDYPYIENMTTIDSEEDIPVQIIGVSITPFRWWVDGSLGSWWYVIVIMGLLLITYVMTKQMSAVVVVSLLLSALALGSHDTGVIYMAPEAVKTLYLIVIGSIVAVVYYGLSQR